MGSRPFPTETRMLSDFQHSGASVLSSMVDQVARAVTKAWIVAFPILVTTSGPVFPSYIPYTVLRTVYDFERVINRDKIWGAEARLSNFGIWLMIHGYRLKKSQITVVTSNA
jgi:hypothetical protein